MTRQNLDEAIGNLEFLIINHFDHDRVEQYSEQLRRFRQQLRDVEAAERYAAAVSLRLAPSRTESG